MREDSRTAPQLDEAESAEKYNFGTLHYDNSKFPVVPTTLSLLSSAFGCFLVGGFGDFDLGVDRSTSLTVWSLAICAICGIAPNSQASGRLIQMSSFKQAIIPGILFAVAMIALDLVCFTTRDLRGAAVPLIAVAATVGFICARQPFRAWKTTLLGVIVTMVSWLLVVGYDTGTPRLTLGAVFAGSFMAFGTAQNKLFSPIVSASPRAYLLAFRTAAAVTAWLVHMRSASLQAWLLESEAAINRLPTTNDGAAPADVTPMELERELAGASGEFGTWSLVIWLALGVASRFTYQQQVTALLRASTPAVVGLVTAISLWVAATVVLVIFGGVVSVDGASWLEVAAGVSGILLIIRGQYLAWREIADGRRATPPFYTLVLSSVVDAVRLTASRLVYFIAIGVAQFASRLAPRELQYYLYPHPIGVVDGATMGVAYLVKPRDGETGPPGVYHCNIGHMDTHDDWVSTNSATFKMLQGLAQDPTAGQNGFCGDIVAEFPMYEYKGAFGKVIPSGHRQLNFSAWRDQQAAHDWYMRSAAHKQIVKQYHKKELSSFSATLAHLEPAKPIRYQVRCRACKRMVRESGVQQCPHCQADALPDMPWF